MTERTAISQKMRDHYEAVWQGGDAWSLESSEFERRRYEHLLTLVGGRRYRCALEIGCGSGRFTRLLAGVAERVLGLDVAPAAIERARVQTAGAGPGVIQLRAADIMEYDLNAEGPWDLVVLSETVYCLGWLYSFFDVAWLARRLLGATSPGGRLLLSNTYGQRGKDWLLQPWLIDTYRDLFRNVGYRLESEDVFRGAKEGVPFEILVSLFEKPSPREPAAGS